MYIQSILTMVEASRHHQGALTMGKASRYLQGVLTTATTSLCVLYSAIDLRVRMCCVRAAPLRPLSVIDMFGCRFVVLRSTALPMEESY